MAIFKEERQNEIMGVLNKDRYSTIEYLAKKLHASPSSIRRDVTALEKKGFVKRSYGGVELITDSFRSSPSFSVHKQKNVEKKRTIAKLASKLIEDKSVIFLDGSSTCYYLAELISTRKNITVVTNNIDSANLLSQADNVLVYCTGGIASKSNRSVLTGSFAESMARAIRADIFFFSTLAMSKSGCLSDDSEEENSLRRIMFQNSEKRVMLCDSSKMGHTSVFSFCDAGDVDAVISDASLEGYFDKEYKDVKLYWE